MCFMLYAGTTRPIPRKSWDQKAPDISVESLKDGEEGIKAHFSLPEVQNIGSTSCCGCDFPFAILQNGGWPETECRETDENVDASDRFNLEALGALLQKLDEGIIELYGIWSGDFDAKPEIREQISFEELHDSKFCFKERGFYTVWF